MSAVKSTQLSVDMLCVRFRRASTGSLGMALPNVAEHSLLFWGINSMSARATANEFAPLVPLFPLHHTKIFERPSFDSAVAKI